MKKTKKIDPMNVLRSVRQMRKVLKEFNRLEGIDQWYVLSRIANRDSPKVFDQVAKERQ